MATKALNPGDKVQISYLGNWDDTVHTVIATCGGEVWVELAPQPDDERISSAVFPLERVRPWVNPDRVKLRAALEHFDAPYIHSDVQEELIDHLLSQGVTFKGES